MFILDFFLGGLMDQFIDWIYSQLVGFFGNFFSAMGNMGVELFEMSWVQSIVLFFSYLAWALYGVGLVVAVFEVGIEYQTGRASVKDAAINAIKGFLAVGCFTLVPVELYKLSVTLQASLTAGITGYGEGFDVLSTDIITSLQGVDIGSAASSGVFGGIGSITSPIMVIFIIIMMGYAIIKCFFSNLKRGGILLIQIAVGSLYMFSVPRGYMDGFIQWCKQIIGLCLTTFLQATILPALTSCPPSMRHNRQSTPPAPSYRQWGRRNEQRKTDLYRLSLCRGYGGEYCVCKKSLPICHPPGAHAHRCPPALPADAG